MASKKAQTDDLSIADPQVRKKVHDWKMSVAERAQKIVHEIMPSKIIHLNDIYTNHKSFTTDFSQLPQILPSSTQADQAAKKRKLDAGSESNNNNNNNNAVLDVDVPVNAAVLDILAVLKKEILELIEMINTVKVWIQLNIPRIEDGNNFGVSIQEDTVNELGRAEDSGFSVLEGMTKYYVTRAKLVSKILKHPNIHDYRQSVLELDEKELINLRLCCLDLRNNFAILHDMITKNMEKIKTPRNSNHMAAIF